MPVSSGDVRAPLGRTTRRRTADGVATFEVAAGTWTFTSTFEPAV
ncbi:hypothetical protein [Streptomyces sp. KL116D]